MTGLCLVADVELMDVFVHIGIRYDFRAAGAVADEAAEKDPPYWRIARRWLSVQ